MARNTLMWLDYVIFGISIVISVAIGVYHAIKRKKNQEDLNEYLVASRKLRPFPVAVSLSVSYVSAVAVLGYSSEMHYYGATYFFYVVGNCLGTLLALPTGLPMFYSLNLLSINEYLTRRYGSLAVLRLSWFWQVCSNCVYAGVVIYGPAVTLEAMSGVPVWISMVLLGTTGTLYTVIGGFKAVIWIDCFQALVMLGGMVAFVIQGSILAGGIGNVWAIYADKGLLKLDINPSPMARQTVWGVLLTGVWHGFFVYGCSQVGIQRVSAVKTLSGTICSALWTIPLRLVLEGIPCLCGVITFAYFALKQCDPLDAGLIQGPSQILPFFVMETLNYPGLPGLFVACVFAAALSNLSSLVNSNATMTWNDLLSKKYDHWNDRRKTLVSKCITALFGGLAIFIAALQANIGGTLMQVIILCESSVLTPCLIIFVVGATAPRVNWKSVTVGALFGWALSTWMTGGAMFHQTHQELDHSVSTNCTKGIHNLTASESDALLGHSIDNLTTTTRYGLVNQTAIPKNIEGLEIVYNISHYWMAPFATAAGFLVAILASYIPGFHSDDGTDLILYYPPVRWLLLRSRQNTTYEPAHEATKDTAI